MAKPKATTRKCSDCEEVKAYTCGGKTPGGDNFYIDATGRRWKGPRCAPCYSIFKYATMKRENNQYKKIETKCPTRKCRVCGKKLKPNRYFNCAGCAPNVQDFIFDEYGLIGFDSAVGEIPEHTYGWGEADDES